MPADPSANPSANPFACPVTASPRLLAQVLVPLALVLGACTPTVGQRVPLGQSGFADYQRETSDWVATHRQYVAQDDAARQAETDWNSPREWRPAGTPQGGVLLVHGLGDSPWSFTDIGEQLARQGYLARTVLLPGHGTRPADMLHARLADWQRVVGEQARILQDDVRRHAGPAAPVWLGGFSTGANLVTDYAYDHPAIAGLLLFSPAFRVGNGQVWLTPLIAWAKPWLTPTDSRQRPQQNAVRYLTVPTNGFAQFYRSSQTVQRQISVGYYDKPVFMVVAQHDSVLDAPGLLDVFHRRFRHPDSRLVWYGTLPPGPAATDSRILQRPDRLPEYRISQFSHMGVLFSPGNPVYGEQGSLRMCWNGQSATAMASCLANETVWYSDWGYQETGKAHARLTFNPYFDWQAGLMAQVMQATAPQAAP